MKFLTLLLIVLYSQISLSQMVFTSPITQNYSHGALEKINRKITVGNETITVESDTSVNTIKKKVFYIQEYSRQEFPEHGLSDFFVCSSKDGLIITYFLIPVVDKIEFMIVMRPSQLNHDPEIFRYLLD